MLQTKPFTQTRSYAELDDTTPSYEDWGKLFAAARSGDLKLVKQYVSEGWKVNRIYPPCTPLGIAVGCRHISVASFLLEQGADPNLFQYHYSSPLCSAAYHSYEMVELLLQYGADPNKAGDYNYAETPLISAVRANEIEIVQLLLAHDANPSLANNNEDTPLNIAVKNGRINVVQLLLQWGADPNYAIWFDEMDEIYSEDQGCRKPLISAVQERNTEIAALLLRHGANPFQEDEKGQTPFHIAEANDDELMVSILRYASLHNNDHSNPTT